MIFVCFLFSVGWFVLVPCFPFLGSCFSVVELSLSHRLTFRPAVQRSSTTSICWIALFCRCELDVLRLLPLESKKTVMQRVNAEQ